MPEILESCPICQNSQLNPFVICQDYTVSQARFSIVQCQNCGFRFTNPRPTEAESGQYYQSENYISHSNTRKGLINQLYQVVRQRALRSKLRLINQLLEPNAAKKILDYGCGTGAFLHTCQQNGWQIAGVEPDAGARSQAQSLTHTPIFSDIFQPEFAQATYSVISLWHVLEHVHQLDRTLEQLKALLAPEGTLLIAVPNSNSQDAQKFGEHWAAYDVPRHLYHFVPETMEKLLAKHQLKLVKYLPMYYDAYYISLLSQKYQKNAVNYFTAFWQGWQSNQWAKRHHNNYSSVIYIIKK
ncbi:MAG: class I SAM-dependent methyltransferase [Microscillaceae bacterium]|jgi:2-polyprenyl-3-methyl-5-hydroxy-6-metoxy-1,4-benzoquinol methylase|nr:class I SAM-dependent methyltransferase [Microscillaceae bacterium]